MKTTTKEHLAKIESILTQIVSVEKSQPMNALQFISYATTEIGKAMGEDVEESKKRLQALQKSVRVFKDNYTDDDSASIKVPVYQNDITTLADKSTKLIDAGKAATGNPDNSVFVNDFVSKLAGLKDEVAKLEEIAAKAAKAEPPKPPEPPTNPAAKDPPAEETDEEKKAKAKKAEEEEAEKAAKAKPAFLDGKDKEKDKGSPPPEAKKADGDIPEGDDATKSKKVDKSLAKPDVSPDGTVWPTDLNQTTEKALDWGRD